MPIPNTSNELRAMGYQFDNESNCRGCGERIEWWITPRGKKMPMTVQHPDPLHKTEEIRVPHWSVFPNAEDFRK